MRDDRHRTLHVIDIQGLHDTNGGPLDRDRADALLRRYRSTVSSRPGDLLRVACEPRFAVEVGLAFRPALLLVRAGRNGPSQALLGSLEPHEVAARFDRVVIASGSGVFACLIQRLRGLGTDVRVVSLCDRVENDLRVAGAPIGMLARQPATDPWPVLAATG